MVAVFVPRRVFGCHRAQAARFHSDAVSGLGEACFPGQLPFLGIYFSLRSVKQERQRV